MDEEKRALGCVPTCDDASVGLLVSMMGLSSSVKAVEFDEEWAYLGC